MTSIKDQFATCVKHIISFSSKHPNEIFYAFAIDSGLLCMNSEEGFERIITKYKENWDNTYNSDLTLDNLKESQKEEAILGYESDKELGITTAKNIDDYRGVH